MLPVSTRGTATDSSRKVCKICLRYPLWLLVPSRSREVLNQAAPDSMLAFVIDDNVFVRKVSKTWESEAGAVTAQWSPFPGIEVTTTITPTATGHCRHHEIDSSFDCEAYRAGFAGAQFCTGLRRKRERQHTRT